MTDDKGAAGPAFTYETATALHMQGRAGEAERAYEAFLKSHPDHGEALHGLGVLCLQSGRPEKAVAHLRRAVEVSGGSATIRNNLGVALCAARRFSEAAEVYREAIRLEPGSVSALANLGKILNHLCAFEEALEVLQRAAGLAPNDAQIRNQLAIALTGCGRPEEALPHFEQAVVLAPGQSDFHCDLGAVLLKLKHPQQAADCYRRALSLAPNSPAALCGLGEAAGGLGLHEKAVPCFERAVALAPDFALAHYNHGTALAYLGRKAEAKKAFARAVELEPGNHAFHSALIGLEKTAADSEHLKALEAQAADADRLDKNDRIALHFTLAKAYDDTGDYARAFEQLQRGNAAKRGRYDVQRDLARFRAIAQAFPAEFLAARAGQGAPAEAPVFIIGMPRSGTTLVEQILASHSVVFGAGEQPILPDFINAGRAGRDFPAAVDTLAEGEWRSLGEAYAKALRALSPQAARITDKLPLNFQLAGLIHITLPKARIIHVRRDPLDTCFSCYSILFDDDLDFAYNLEDLGRYYRGYQGLMEHWQTVLPAGAMLEVQYEKLVADLEPEARRLIDFCGLAWDERCLKFHETVRPVETASMHQVRQPLYRTSVGRAARYAPWLEPLQRALAGDAAP